MKIGDIVYIKHTLDSRDILTLKTDNSILVGVVEKSNMKGKNELNTRTKEYKKVKHTI